MTGPAVRVPVLVFAKPPRAGVAKTRLAQSLGAEAAVIRYVVNAEYLEHLLEEYRRLAEEARVSTATPSGSADPVAEGNDEA